MNQQRSFTKIERQLLPAYRSRINTAESTEDIRNFFQRSVIELLTKALPNYHFGQDDILFDPDEDLGYIFSKRLSNDRQFQDACRDSDLLYIVKRLSGLALRRYAHLKTYPDKTEAKMYPVPGSR